MDLKTKFDFDRVAIYGRSIDEYVKMFNLDLMALKGKRILDCCAGPAAFACQAAAMDIEVVACDPIYQLEVEALRSMIDQDAKAVLKKHADNPTLLYQQVTPTIKRREAMEIFLKDLPTGKCAGRYVTGQLPDLPFADGSFDMVLCGNFLFLYSDKASGGMMTHATFDYKFHCDSLSELLRICRQEVRIYPLQGPGVKEHAYLLPIMEKSVAEGHRAELVPVMQRDLIGADRMLRLLP